MLKTLDCLHVHIHVISTVIQLLALITMFWTKRRTWRNVASTKSCMQPIVVSAKWFQTICHAPECASGAVRTVCDIQVLGMHGFRFFSRLVGWKDTWSKKCWVVFWNDGPKHYQTNHSWHLDSILHLHTDTDTCMPMYFDCWWYSKTFLKWPLKKEDQLSLNAGQKYCGAFCNTFDLH